MYKRLAIIAAFAVFAVVKATSGYVQIQAQPTANMYNQTGTNAAAVWTLGTETLTNLTTESTNALALH